MKSITKISLCAIALITIASLTSCSVEYRTRHPRHHKVVVVGMEKTNIPSDSVRAGLTVNPQVNTASSTNVFRQK